MDEELQRYRISQAEAWLSKVRRLVAYERAMREAAEVQYEMADGLRGLDYSRDQVAVSPTPDAIPNAVIAHDEAGDSLSSIADSARERIAQAARALDKMPDPTEAAALTFYYIACRKWEAVCVKMDYTWDGMMKLRRRALLHAYDVMPHSERDPMESAI